MCNPSLNALNVLLGTLNQVLLYLVIYRMEYDGVTIDCGLLIQASPVSPLPVS